MADVNTTNGPRATLWLLRVLVVIVTLGVLAQPVLAGGYLSGAFNFLGYHEATAHGITALLMPQGFAALLYWLGGRGSIVPLLLSVLQFFAVGLQEGMGYARVLAVHIPLGVFIVILTLYLCVWVFRRSAHLSRVDRRASTEERA